MTKICRKCGEQKPLSEFGKQRRNADGCEARCKSCYNRQQREKRQSIAKIPSPSAVIMNGQKGCSKCRKILPVSHFSASSKVKSGLQSQCKVCQKTIRKTARPVKPRRFPPFKGYGFPECRERQAHDGR